MLNWNIRVLEVLVISTVLLFTVYDVEGRRDSYTRSRVGKDPKYNGQIRATGAPAIITGTFFVVLMVVIGCCIFCCLVCRRKGTSKTQSASLSRVSVAPVTNTSALRSTYYHNQTCNVDHQRTCSSTIIQMPHSTTSARSTETEEIKNKISNSDVPPSYSSIINNTGNSECCRFENSKHQQNYSCNTNLQHNSSIDMHERIEPAQHVVNTQESAGIASVHHHHENDLTTLDGLALPNSNITMLNETRANDDQPFTDRHENYFTNSQEHTTQMTSITVSNKTRRSGGITSEMSPLPQINSAIPIQTAQSEDYPVIDIIETI